MSRPHPPSSATSPCFRTDAEGNLPLSRDWCALLNGVRRFPLVVLQTRNAYARLISLAPFPALTWSRHRSYAQSESADLTLRPARWRQARARFAHCPCCESVGKIQVFDTTGAECLQLCAHPETPPADWADFLAPLTASPNATPSSVPHGLFPTSPRFTADTDTTLHDATLLFTLIQLFATQEAPLGLTLDTAAVTHRRELKPRRVTYRQGLLTVTDDIGALQLALPALRHLAVNRRRIELIGRDGASLLTLHPAATPDGVCLWSAILHTTLFRN